jgi:hypothetical protein
MDLEGIDLCDQDTAGKLAAIAALHFRIKGQTVFPAGPSRPTKKDGKAKRNPRNVRNRRSPELAKG